MLSVRLKRGAINIRLTSINIISRTLPVWTCLWKTSFLRTIAKVGKSVNFNAVTVILVIPIVTKKSI